MTRLLTSDQQAAIADTVIKILIAVRLDFANGVIRLHSGSGQLDFGGEIYTGVGDLGSISNIAEDGALSRNTVTLTLSGIPSSAFDMKEIAFAEHYQGRDIRAYLILLDSTETIIDEPIQAFRGRMDTCSLSMGETVSIRLTAESRLADWDRARNRRYTDQDQQTEYPGDLGFQFVSQSTEYEIRWMM
jgi:hypothetical protein